MSEITPKFTSSESCPSDLATIVIEPSRGWGSLGLQDVWEYRELLYLLVWREIRGIYRQTALGVSWLFLRPLLNVFVLSVVFGGIVKVPSDNLPYPLFSMSAMLPWLYFTTSVLRASSSLVHNMEIISKVYFPKMVMTIASVLSGLVDFGASFIVFLVFLLIYQMPLRLEIITLPIFIIAMMLLALTVGLWLATLSVKYRDVAFAVNFILVAMMYASPVIYPASLVPPQLSLLYNLNPMTGIIQGFRWALLGSEGPPGIIFYVSMGVVLVALIIGALIFRRTERTIVDML